MENKPVNKKSDNSNKKGDSSKVILILVILILLGAIGYLVFTNQEQENTIALKDERISADSLEKVKTIKEYQDLQLHYQKLKEENQALGLQTDSLDAKIQDLNETIYKVRNANIAEVRRLKSNLNSLKSQFSNIKFTLDSMVALNDTLKFKLDSMRLNDKLLADSIANLDLVKRALSEKVAIASVLKAENLQVAAINAKGKEAVSDEYKAKNINKLKITFNLADNKVAEKDAKDVYLRLIEPNGSTLFDGDKTFTIEGIETFYTEKKTFNFDNTKQQIAFIYENSNEFKSGNYNVEIFIEGSKIGETVFAVK